ncbi:MAG: family 20 glycosylhydrolase [Clostridia bacterium]|nr:family 20 glycosylhydrolase [Clostridia bacterium]
MKMLKRTLAMFMVLCMMFSIVPMTVFADDTAGTADVQTTAVDNDFQRILHLDCGRKYYTVDWIKALITEMKAAGFTHLQLAFGNDGLRFLLDDMTVGSYSDADVTAAVHNGNIAYNAKKTYTTELNELTQSEMDEIIAHANTTGIEIIPLFNNPGHMYTMITAMTSLGMTPGYNGSASTIDLDDSTAVAFMKELLQKYISYFANKGCSIFNIGADEYANDNYSSGSMGFGHLLSSGKYPLFVDYVNELNTIIKAAGMKTMAFNDGIYFQNNTSYAFDKDILISFWSSGWGSGSTAYKSASASTMAGLGHPMYNTNGDYYYILGVNDTFTPGTGTTHADGYHTAAEGFSNTAFMGSTVSDPAGSVFCVWADYPGAETETEVAKYIRPIMRVIAARMQDSNDYEVDSIVAGGFNADGTINVVDPEEPDVPVTPEEPENVTLTDNGISVTAPGLTAITVTETSAPTAIDGAKNVKAWDLTPATANGKYTGEATVALPIPEGWDTAKVRAFVVNADNTIETIIGNVANGMYEFVMPHFSVGGLYELETAAEELKDSISTNGGTPDSYDQYTASSLTNNSQYLIVYKLNDTQGVAITNNNGSISSTNVDINGTKAIPASDVQDSLWTYSSSRSVFTTYRYLSNNGYYLYPNRTSTYPRKYNLSLSEDAIDLTISSSNNAYTIYANYTYVVYKKDDGVWGGSNSSSQSVILYEYTPGTSTYTVDASLQESRIAALTVENDNYTDASWTAYESALKAAENKFTTVEGASYTSETAANTALNELKAAVNALETAKNALEKAVTITIKYVVTGNDTPIKTETRPVSEKDTSVTVKSFNANNKFYIVEDTTLAITPATVKEYTVTVTETEENLSSVAPLTVEYWITNQQVTDPNTTLNNLEIKAQDVHTENGIAFSDLIPSTIIRNERSIEYWQVRLLDVLKENDSSSATEHQTNGPGDDDTNSGTLVQKIRYWNGNWQVLSNTDWVLVDTSTVSAKYVDSSNNTTYAERSRMQLVAYYMEIVDIKNENLTTELHINAADWGKKGDNTPNSDWMDVNNYCSISIQIVYESGTTNPVDTTAANLKDKTLVFGYWSDGRGIGTYKFSGLEEFDIYKVTAETGSVTATMQSSTSGVNVTNLTWDRNEKTVWEGDYTREVTIYNNAKNPSSEDPYDNLMWDENKEAILVRIYVKAVEKQDSLSVVYYDEKFGDELYTYSIQVADNVTFENITPTPSAFSGNAGRINVSGCGITNFYGQTDKFQTDLTKVPEAVGKYSSELYSYTGSVISEDKTILYLYYNINTQILKPNLVVDFGLPVTFKLSDIVTNTGTVDNVGNHSARYGTVSYNSTTKTFTYVPTKILQNLDVLSITLTVAGTTSTTNVGITPATTVYYEESFLQYEGSWKGHTTAPTKTQTTAVLGGKNGNYGYDFAYTQENDAIGSNGTYAYTTTAGATASFTFTGTGFELYGNSNGSTGIVSVLSQANADNAEKVNKIYMIDTKLSTGTTDATSQQSGTYYSLPFISEKALPYGTYTVTIKRSASNETNNPIQIDGVRIINTIKDSSIYVEDLEDNPSFYQIRDMVLSAVGVSGATSEQVYKAISTVEGQSQTSAVLLDENTELDDNTAADLLKNGPKNELYLYPGQTLTFKVKTNRVMQLGLKSPIGSAEFELTVDGTPVAPASLSTSVDMFYKIADKLTNADGTATDAKEYDVIIRVTKGLLSVTDLKICDDPNAAFVPLTQADIENVLSSIAGVPEEPVITYADAELNVRFVDYTGRVISSGSLTANGVTGTDMTFSASDILGAASMPARYAFVDADSVTDAIVACGESETVTVQIGRVATLRVVYMNLFGRKLDTVVITRVQTKAGYAVIPASEIRSQAPAGARVIWPIPTYVSYGSSVIVTVPVV